MAFHAPHCLTVTMRGHCTDAPSISNRLQIMSSRKADVESARVYVDMSLAY